MLRKNTGNMYEFVDYTFNMISGRCSHKCSYCYMKGLWRDDAYFNSKELKTDLGKDNFIFVGSGTDMFATDIPKTWIVDALDHCNKFDNIYLFQSKNPARFLQFLDYFPKRTILATTIESNRINKVSYAPSIMNRATHIIACQKYFEIMITIEPILAFDLDVFVDLLRKISPAIITIGADSKGTGLDEPSKKEVIALIKECKKFSKVILKHNLSRIIGIYKGK